jgi:hypothetical protein
VVLPHRILSQRPPHRFRGWVRRAYMVALPVLVDVCAADSRHRRFGRYVLSVIYAFAHFLRVGSLFFDISIRFGMLTLSAT